MVVVRWQSYVRTTVIKDLVLIRRTQTLLLTPVHYDGGVFLAHVLKGLG